VNPGPPPNPMTTPALPADRPERERDGAQLALDAQDAAFRALADRLCDGIYVRRGIRLVYANARMSEIFDRLPADLGGVDFIDLFDRHDWPAIETLLGADGTGTIGSEPRILRSGSDEARELELYETSALIGGEPCCIGVVVDTSAAQRSAADNARRAEQLRRAQKLEAVGRLVGGIAHDFNNILMVIQGSANLILMGSEDSNPWRSDLEEIVRATRKAGELTGQLLAFGRKQVLRPHVLNLNTAIEDVHRILHRVLGDEIELRLSLAPDLGNVRADPGQLDQMVLNLLMNARDAMPSGGFVTIQTDNVEMTAADAARHPFKIVLGSYARLTVSDTGIGMTERTLARIFEPFFTTKRSGTGAGLGLSMAYGFVKQSGGYIWATSRPGEGSQFVVHLPRVNDPVEKVAAHRPTKAPRGTGRILLVEDEEPVRMVTRRILEEGGYEVIEATCGAEALSRFHEASDEIDLVLTDIVMPQMGGRELAGKLRERSPALPLVFMTGYADDRRLRRQGDPSGIPVIHKPFDSEDLLGHLAGILGHGESDDG
jgi:signal transduction histidine kinase/CheY-like chemotaxis protein